MKLYYSPGACSQVPHIVLHELGLPHQLVRVDLAAKKTESGADYLAINPKGCVPALGLDDGFVLTEGPAIVQYLADLKPESGLAPVAGSRERYILQSWLNFITSDLHQGFSPLFKPDVPEAYKSMARAKLESKFAYVDGQLAHRPYLLGDQYTVADTYLFVVSGWGKFTGLDAARFTNVAALRERVAARPAVTAMLKAEGLLR